MQHFWKVSFFDYFNYRPIKRVRFQGVGGIPFSSLGDSNQRQLGLRQTFKLNEPPSKLASSSSAQPASSSYDDGLFFVDKGIDAAHSRRTDTNVALKPCRKGKIEKSLENRERPSVKEKRTSVMSEKQSLTADTRLSPKNGIQRHPSDEL